MGILRPGKASSTLEAEAGKLQQVKEQLSHDSGFHDRMGYTVRP